jgi:hypothetical protein
MIKTATYPELDIQKIENPNRFFAVPLIGFLVKVILLIPVAIELIFLGIFQLIVTFINSWVVLFTGKYWQFAYQYTLGILRLRAKITFYLYGLTNHYPWFNFKIKDNYKIEIERPNNSNRLFAVPLLGGTARIMLLIPYLIFNSVLSTGAGVGAFFSFYKVLFRKIYPESTFEFERDATRVNLAVNAYMFGLSDNYPSPHISMNHQTIKIALIVAGTILAFANLGSGNLEKRERVQPPLQELQEVTVSTSAY